MNRNHILCLAATTATLLGLTTCPDLAIAQTSTSATATMAVSIEVTANCTVAAEPLAFGAVFAAQAPSLAAVASIEVACGPEVPFTVALDDGQNTTSGTRRALDPATGQYIEYDIFADAAHTQRWGSLAEQAVAGVTTSTGTARLTAYGLLGSEGGVAAGSYGDLVTVTTNF